MLARQLIQRVVKLSIITVHPRRLGLSVYRLNTPVPSDLDLSLCCMVPRRCDALGEERGRKEKERKNNFSEKITYKENKQGKFEKNETSWEDTSRRLRNAHPSYTLVLPTRDSPSYANFREQEKKRKKNGSVMPLRSVRQRFSFLSKKRSMGQIVVSTQFSAAIYHLHKIMILENRPSFGIVLKDRGARNEPLAACIDRFER